MKAALLSSSTDESLAAFLLLATVYSSELPAAICLLPTALCLLNVAALISVRERTHFPGPKFEPATPER